MRFGCMRHLLKAQAGSPAVWDARSAEDLRHMCFRPFKALICAFERVREPANKASRVRTKAEADLEICYESTHQCPQRKSERNVHLSKHLSRFAIKLYIEKIHCWFLRVSLEFNRPTFIGKSVNCQKYAAFPGSTQQRPFHAPLACRLGFGVYRGRVVSLAFNELVEVTYL